MTVATASPALATGLTPNADAVLNVLLRHRGRDRAVGLEIVASLSGLSERVVQYVVVELIERHDFPIGSAVKEPMGYYLIQTDEELAESLSQLTHRLTALARRIAALKRTTTPIVLLQIALELDDPPKEHDMKHEEPHERPH